LLPNVRRVGDQLLEGLRGLQRKHPVITEVRGRALMLGIQLDRPGQAYVERARERGLLINCTHETVLRLLPPFTLSSEEAHEIVDILDLLL
jgi:acetylornithine/succinyldiaminopimelate/putrescine aminotransferase